MEDESLECGFVIGAECGDVVRDRKLFLVAFLVGRGMDELGRLGWDEGAGRLPETLCLSLKYSVLLSQLCLEQNQDRLKKICPNTFYERFDEEINAHCGACVVRDGMVVIVFRVCHLSVWHRLSYLAHM